MLPCLATNYHTVIRILSTLAHPGFKSHRKRTLPNRRIRVLSRTSRYEQYSEKILDADSSSISKLGRESRESPSDPLILYFGLAMLIPVISWLISFIGWSRVHPVTGETIGLINLLTSEQIQRMFVEAEHNFWRFSTPPGRPRHHARNWRGRRSGLIGTSLKLLVEATPRSLISVVIVFAGVMSSMAADAGYVVLTPSECAFRRHGPTPIGWSFSRVCRNRRRFFPANLLLT